MTVPNLDQSFNKNKITTSATLLITSWYTGLESLVKIDMIASHCCCGGAKCVHKGALLV